MQAEILVGEAPESDEEDELESKPETTIPREVVVKNSKVVVSGEASETDEEDEDEGTNAGEKTSPARSVEQKWLDAKSKKETKKFKYDSLFHKKLRERNRQLRTDIVGNVVNMYHMANLKLEGSVYHLNKAQTAAQDVSHNVHNMFEDLKLLRSKVENIITAEFLPSFSAHLNTVIILQKQSGTKSPLPAETAPVKD